MISLNREISTENEFNNKCKKLKISLNSEFSTV